jgi:hypothetical protein
MPSSQHALMEATRKRAVKLEARGKPVDFKELLRMEPFDRAHAFEEVDSGERLQRWHVTKASHHDIGLAAVVVAGPLPYPIRLRNARLPRPSSTTEEQAASPRRRR